VGLLGLGTAACNSQEGTLAAAEATAVAAAVAAVVAVAASDVMSLDATAYTIDRQVIASDLSNVKK
jgi:hypothetical protein